MRWGVEGRGGGQTWLSGYIAEWVNNPLLPQSSLLIRLRPSTNKYIFVNVAILYSENTQTDADAN